jgi:hypothetical protein
MILAYHKGWWKEDTLQLLWPLMCLGAALVVVAVVGSLKALRRWLSR